MTFNSFKFRQALHRAFINPDIMPVDCIDILQDVYGKQLDRMKPATITQMVRYMMQTAIDTSDIMDDIEETVQDFCNAY